MSATCHRCGGSLAVQVRFCGACGAATREHARLVGAAIQQTRQAVARAASALGLVVLITLGGLVLGPHLLGDQDPEGWLAVLLGAAAVFGAALVAGLVDGPLRASLPLATRPLWMLMALPAALVTLGAALVYLGMLTQGASDPIGEPVLVPIATWVAVVVLAPVGEEWLCRGVAWRSAVTLSSPRTAVLLTAILFAFLHGLGDGYLLELPHRFVMGLAAGWLRWQSGSLLPGVVVHGVHNFVAITWLG